MGARASIDIEKLRARIAATIAQARADDPRELRRRIADLEKQLASRAFAPKVEKVIERVEVPVISGEQLRSLDVAVTTLAEVSGQLVMIAPDLSAALARVAAPAPLSEDAPAAPLVDQAALMRTQTPAKPRPVPAPRPAEPTNGAAPAGDLSLRAGERKMLAVLAQRYPLKFTREELGERTGYTASGGTFGAYLGTLRRNGLVEVQGGEVRASAGLFLHGVMS